MESPEPVDICNQHHAWTLNSTVSNGGVVTRAALCWVIYGTKLNKFFMILWPLPVIAHQTDAQDTLEYALSMLVGSRLV